MTVSSNRHEPIFDIHPVTGVGIEVFYADTALTTFGGAALSGSGGLGGAVSRPKAQRSVRFRRAIQRIGTLYWVTIWGPIWGPVGY
ncbi:hypothetical protein [Bradyrhizobium erythrophlei]|uniref:Uncharacterized protein n=1 Tax=Bradyrhizobium erythrophlei TaxID=1437360 RepID=A0A1M5P5K4_9BRAD|nr:hypothetical protein [Bradyrhizobium erythrophlei]SHG97104.1 hypothetical protein SAMN05444169_5040 [Bradyrhizobium erythrophlei]